MILSSDHPSVRRAAMWLREHYGLDRGKTVYQEFESEWHCKIASVDREDPWGTPRVIQFNSEEELTLFLLRWM